MYQNEKEEAKRLQGVRKLRQDEEIAWAPPRNMTKWPDWEEARKLENAEWRLVPEGEAEVPEIIIVSGAVEGTLWTWRAKAVTSRQKQSPREEKESCSMRARRSSGIGRNTRLCERRKRLRNSRKRNRGPSYRARWAFR